MTTVAKASNIVHIGNMLATCLKMQAKCQFNILALCWHHAYNMLATCWLHAGNMLETYYPYAGNMLASCWQHTGNMLATCWQHAGNMLEKCLKHAILMLVTCLRHALCQPHAGMLPGYNGLFTKLSSALLLLLLPSTRKRLRSARPR